MCYYIFYQKSFFFWKFLIEFIVCMNLKVCVWLDAQKSLPRGGLFYPRRWTYMIPRNDVLIVLSLPPIKKKRRVRRLGGEQFLFDDFVQKTDKLRRYKQKTDFWTSTSSSSFSKSSNLRGKISNMLLHCRTHGFWQGGGGV